ncbi:uncharacterized protein LACBIDRAFT_330816 [Laccaria bicolor S238N-H82]|uniref:Predicted protein n=1 Tax=Laccaria bicolor (strain S238N-H82 / ATCC MYA-4686) TaxID=486041 RepID=B0DMK3_LACBS|nr:uncharacterized protein LACBIDRAFT_330816 [Laccaria bicolor S238N-H82]EDR04303.1 predicted protein [Laccaria bicolor S238N-H82]|eukprot:XP_001885194.1 predicted protein [Laccaria bicolor S238N-H82]
MWLFNHSPFPKLEHCSEILVYLNPDALFVVTYMVYVPPSGPDLSPYYKNSLSPDSAFTQRRSSVGLGPRLFSRGHRHLWWMGGVAIAHRFVWGEGGGGLQASVSVQPIERTASSFNVGKVETFDYITYNGNRTITALTP